MLDLHMYANILYDQQFPHLNFFWNLKLLKLRIHLPIGNYFVEIGQHSINRIGRFVRSAARPLWSVCKSHFPVWLSVTSPYAQSYTYICTYL